MAEIKPFAPLVYTEKSGDILKNVSPPYDIISPKEREALVERSEYNVIGLELPIGEDRYNEAAKLLERFKNEEILAHDGKEGIYVYAETFDVKGKEYTVYGMICRVKLYDFSERVILPHEETLTKAKQDRFDLMCTTYSNISPIYALYSDSERAVPSVLTKAMETEPKRCFSDEKGVLHRLWKIEDEQEIEKIVSVMREKQLFIADGHHRYETALRFKKHLAENGELEKTDAAYQMMLLVDMENEGLVVFPTHRMVNPPEEIETSVLLERISEHFEVSEITGSDPEAALDSNKHTSSFVLCEGEKKYLLVLKNKDIMKEKISDMSDAYRGLDVSVLHTLILGDILGIDKENMAGGKSLTYTRDLEEAIESAESGSAKFVFLLNPTKIHEIKDVSLAGEKMPQKSTYFHPKPVTGLTINDLKRK